MKQLETIGLHQQMSQIINEGTTELAIAIFQTTDGPVMPRRSFVSFKRRESNKAHGCELPYYMRYSEAITSTTKGRGAGYGLAIRPYPAHRPGPSFYVNMMCFR